MAIEPYEGGHSAPRWVRADQRPPAPKPEKPPKPAKPSLRGLLPAVRSRPRERTLTRREQRLSNDAVESFTELLGGRQALTDTLAVADTSVHADRVIDALLNPQYEKWSLRRICNALGITVADLFTAYKKALIAKAHIEATRVIAAKVAPVVEDVMARATPVPLVCPACENTLPKKRGCLSCASTGFIRSEPDLDRQKLALELAQLTQKSGGITVNQNQQVAPSTTVLATDSGTLIQLHQAVGEVLFAPGRRRAFSPRHDGAPVIDDPREPPPAHREPHVIELPRDQPPDDDTTTDDDEEEPDREPRD